MSGTSGVGGRRAFWRPGTVAPGSDVAVHQQQQQQQQEAQSRVEGGGAAVDGQSEAALSLDGLLPYNARAHLSIAQQRLLLPVYAQRAPLLFSVSTHQVTVLIGATGSGKSTQVPQYLDAAGWTGGARKVAITQPRRIAAISLARRVAEEMGVEVGAEVGYRVRFDDRTDASGADRTRVVFMTDGMLLRETLSDPLLSAYSVVVVDEAHERSVASDLLLGLLRRLLTQRSDLRLIVQSATLSVDDLRGLFAGVRGGCAVIAVEGRQWPVDVYYTKAPVKDYVQAAVDTVLHVHRTQPPGDVLVFMTGREEVETVVSAIREQNLSVLALPLYSGLSTEVQMSVFAPAPADVRKVVVSTNIAEASLTIDGIVHVVDCGFVKLRTFAPSTGVSALTVAPVSKASAQQRAGRAGRVRAGVCYRLYTEDAYEALEASTPPEIQRMTLTGVVLQLKALGVDDLLHFPFVSPPPTPLLLSALDHLYTVGALTSRGVLTPLGRDLAFLPLDPFIGRMLLAAAESDCVEEALSIAAMLCIPFPYMRPSTSLRSRRRVPLSSFAVEQGDHLTLLNLYSAFSIRPASSHRAFCRRHRLHLPFLVQAQHIRSQLVTYLGALGRPRAGAGRASADSVLKAVVSGFFHHAARRGPAGDWRDVRSGLRVDVDRESVLGGEEEEEEGEGVDGDWLVYHELVESADRRFMRVVSVIDGSWLLEAAPHFFTLSTRQLATAQPPSTTERAANIVHRELF